MKSANVNLLNPSECSSEFLNTLTYALDQLDTMAGVLDTEGKFTFANQAALKNIGATREQLTGVPFSESPWRNHSPKAKKATDEMIVRALAGESFLLEEDIIDPDGRLIPTLFSLSPVRDADGKIIALIPEAKMIFKLKNLPNRLEKERWETQQWIDSMGAFVAKCDPKGRIVACNRPFLAMLNMELEEIVGHYVCDMVSRLRYFGKSQKQLQEAVRNAGKGKKAVSKRISHSPGILKERSSSM
jgi:PAS domain S-box